MTTRKKTNKKPDLLARQIADWNSIQNNNHVFKENPGAPPIFIGPSRTPFLDYSNLQKSNNIKNNNFPNKIDETTFDECINYYKDRLEDKTISTQEQMDDMFNFIKYIDNSGSIYNFLDRRNQINFLRLCKKVKKYIIDFEDTDILMKSKENIIEAILKSICPDKTGRLDSFCQKKEKSLINSSKQNLKEHEHELSYKKKSSIIHPYKTKSSLSKKSKLKIFNNKSKRGRITIQSKVN